MAYDCQWTIFALQQVTVTIGGSRISAGKGSEGSKDRGYNQCVVSRVCGRAVTRSLRRMPRAHPQEATEIWCKTPAYHNWISLNESVGAMALRGPADGGRQAALT
jgi:hypothetical protein